MSVNTIINPSIIAQTLGYSKKYAREKVCQVKKNRNTTAISWGQYCDFYGIKLD